MNSAPKNRAQTTDGTPVAQTVMYFPYIDGLRAVSILAVVLFHLDRRFLPGGFAGVDVFFVVSGFIISGSLHNRSYSSLPQLFIEFYARRFRRILPAMLCMLLVTSSLVVLFIPQGSFLEGTLGRTASSAFFGFSNFRLAFSADYFLPLAEFNPFTHTWSLAVEEQFYAAFPIIYFLLRTQKTAAFASIMLAALCVASIAYGWFEPNFRYNLGFYSTLGRFWELGSGVLLYAVLARLQLYRPGHLTEISMASYAGALLLLSAFVIDTPQAYPVPGAILPVMGSICMITALHGRIPTSILGRALTSTPVLWVGLVSYSLYLWHWPVFSMFRWTIGFEEPWQKALALALVGAITLASYRYLETPVRYAKAFRTPLFAIPLSLTAVALFWSGSTLLFSNARYVSASVVTRHIEDWFGPRSTVMKAGDCRIAQQRLTLSSTFADQSTPLECGHVEAPALFVIGDSHAFALRPMLLEYARRNGARVTLYNSSCGFPKFPLSRGNCSQSDDAVIADIEAAAKPGDVIFLSSLRLPRFHNQWNTEEIDTSAVWRAAEKELAPAAIEAAATLQRLNKLDVDILFGLPTPIFKIPLYRCADWFNRINPVCKFGSSLDRAFEQSYRRPVLQFADAIKARVSRFYTWDPFPTLCPNEICSMWHDGRPMFFDGDHVTYFSNQLLADDFIATVKRLRGNNSAAPPINKSR